MTMLTLGIGGVLIATGLIAYLATAAASVTALIPAFVGLLLLVAGLMARRNPAARRHSLHAAMAVALLGVLGSLMNVFQLGALLAGTAERPGAVITSTIMFVLLTAYLIVGVRSFVAARTKKA